ncbi:MAG: leucine-rich repeat domain-containing protein [Holosporales bacterium]|jgi:hypothetical protein|nr:leucine-rich repeat domain-containing protein [Holosporales bacterium]
MRPNKKDINKRFYVNTINAIHQILFIFTIASAAANVTPRYNPILTYKYDVSYILCVLGTSGSNPSSVTPLTTAQTQVFLQNLALACQSLPSGQEYKIAAVIEQKKHINGIFFRNKIYKSGCAMDTVAVVSDSGDPLEQRPIRSKMCCLPRGVEVIGECAFAFQGFRHGFAIEYGSHLVTLEKRCFEGMNAPSICIPEGVRIMDAALSSASISLITINSDIHALPNSLFEGATFDTLVLKYRIDEIGYHSFSCCKSNEPSRILSESKITQIGHQALTGTMIQKFTGTLELLNIRKVAFLHSDVIEADLSLCLKVNIERKVFCACENLSSVVLPSNIVLIPKGMFAGCKSLTSIFFPESVISLESSCFGKSGLREISLPLNLASIHNSAIAQTRLQALTIPSRVLFLNSRAMYGIPVVTFERSTETRYFHNAFDSTNYAPACQVHNAFFVTEVQVRNLTTEEQFDDFAIANCLDETRTFNSSVLIRWPLNNLVLPPFINDDALRQIAKTTLQIQVCVPGENDEDLFKHLRDGHPYIRQERSTPVLQIIEAQSRRAKDKLAEAQRQRQAEIDSL